MTDGPGGPRNSEGRVSSVKLVRELRASILLHVIMRWWNTGSSQHVPAHVLLLCSLRSPPPRLSLPPFCHSRGHVRPASTHVTFRKIERIHNPGV